MKKYYTLKEDGLCQDWEGNSVFCNPPYGRDIHKWVEKCHDESYKEDTTVVMLIPSRTDTKWFHKYIYQKAEIRFIEERIKFGGSPHNAPFPNMVVIWK